MIKKEYFQKTFVELSEKDQKMLGRPVLEFFENDEVYGIYEWGVCPTRYQVRAGSLIQCAETIKGAACTLKLHLLFTF